MALQEIFFLQPLLLSQDGVLECTLTPQRQLEVRSHVQSSDAATAFAFADALNERRRSENLPCSAAHEQRLARSLSSRRSPSREQKYG